MCFCKDESGTGRVVQILEHHLAGANRQAVQHHRKEGRKIHGDEEGLAQALRLRLVCFYCCQWESMLVKYKLKHATQHLKTLHHTISSEQLHIIATLHKSSNAQQ
jgi:hypothetical protein